VAELRAMRRRLTTSLRGGLLVVAAVVVLAVIPVLIFNALRALWRWING
jgi:hypothetical protein